MIILGIDPGYAIVGYGVIEKTNSGTRVVDYGVITTHKDERMCDRLVKIAEALEIIIDKYKPDCLALEELFFKNNQKTAINVAMARGVLLRLYAFTNKTSTYRKWTC